MGNVRTTENEERGLNKDLRSPRRAHRAPTRNAFLTRMLGVSVENHVAKLKQHLHDAGLIDSPAAQLETVVVQDIDHYYDLLAEHGVPLARDADQVPERRRVTLELPPSVFVLLALILAALFLDDVLELLTHIDPLPWF